MSAWDEYLECVEDIQALKQKMTSLVEDAFKEGAIAIFKKNSSLKEFYFYSTEPYYDDEVDHEYSISEAYINDYSTESLQCTTSTYFNENYKDKIGMDFKDYKMAERDIIHFLSIFDIDHIYMQFDGNLKVIFNREGIIVEENY